MNIEEYLKTGDLAGAIEFQNNEVRTKPTDIDARYVLFGLLVFAGNLERARKQIDALERMGPEMAVGCTLYRNLVTSEEERKLAYLSQTKPQVPPTAKDYIHKRAELFAKLKKEDPKALAEAVTEMGDVGCALQGTVDGVSFSGIRDYDDLLGPVLEVFAGGRYLWMPFEDIKRIEISKPEAFLDLLWIHTKIESAEGANYDVHLPVLYGESYKHEDNQVKLGRMTQWCEAAEDVFQGFGQKTILFATEGDDKEIPLLTIRNTEIG